MLIKVSKGAKIRNRYNLVPHLTQDTNGKVTNSQLDTTNENQEVSPLNESQEVSPVTIGSLMKVKSIAECNTFDLHEVIIGLENQFVVFLRMAVLYRYPYHVRDSAQIWQ